MVTNYGETTPFIRNVFTLNTCAPIVGSQVICHQTEQELLAVSIKLCCIYIYIYAFGLFITVSIHMISIAN